MQLPKSHEPKGWHSRGYLPHFDSPEIVQHVIFRSADSLPSTIMDSLPEIAEERARCIDRLLDSGIGTRPLSGAIEAGIVEDALLHFDSARYHLLAWCVMPNHVHVAMEQVEGYGLGNIIHSWKRFTALEINRLHGTTGKFWANDYFDRFVRDEDHLARTIGYIERNPVKAGLCSTPEAWRCSSASHRHVHFAA